MRIRLKPGLNSIPSINRWKAKNALPIRLSFSPKQSKEKKANWFKGCRGPVQNNFANTHVVALGHDASC